MSNPPARLPARPSLEQLRKRAKERLRIVRADEPAATLADEQYALARDYGFESWPKLVHHVRSVLASARIEQFDRLAADLLAGYGGDTEALRRLIAHCGVGYDTDRFGARLRSRVDELRGRAAGDPSLADVRHVVAYEYGFESWAALDEALGQPPERTPDPRLGRSASPPFYRIDPDRNTLEARPPLTDGDWERIFAIMKERGLTGIKAAAIGDGAISRLSRLDFVTRLDIGGPALSDDGLLHLAGMPQLEELSLAGRVTDRGFKTWREREIGYDLMTFAPEANNLLLDGPITDRGLAGLAGLDGLFGLGLFWHAHAFTGAGLAALSVLPNLRFLACPGEGCDDAAMRSIATLPKLRMLLAQGTIASDDGFVALSRCRSLEYLWGRECPNLQGRGFRALASMPASWAGGELQARGRCLARGAGRLPVAAAAHADGRHRRRVPPRGCLRGPGGPVVHVLTRDGRRGHRAHRRADAEDVLRRQDRDHGQELRDPRPDGIPRAGRALGNRGRHRRRAQRAGQAAAPAPVHRHGRTARDTGGLGGFSASGAHRLRELSGASAPGGFGRGTDAASRLPLASALRDPTSRARLRAPWPASTSAPPLRAGRSGRPGAPPIGQPLLAFSTLELHPALLRGVGDLGFTTPTPIQSQAIPQALAGRDLLASAVTGSGKTAAFLLPILHNLIGRARGTTRALVLAPTRELALQILDDLRGLARHTSLKAAAVHGGVAMGPQQTALRQGVDVIVATPGRLLDHFQHGYAALAGLEYLVLDEADRMLDMGFLPDIRRVLRHVPRPRQTFLFSATMPAPIEALTREILRDPARLALQRRPAPAQGVTHAVYPVPTTLKGPLLVELLRRGHVNEALVFTRTKHRADRLCKLLNRHGISAERIHGNRSQPQRTKALAAFKAGEFRVLVATDIAARGIDVESLGHVVNFDVPAVPDDYIHRVGRTARAAETGEAFTLVAPEDEDDLKRIERAVGAKLPRVRLDGFAYGATPDAPLEVPIGERIAAIRAKKAEDRGRAAAKAARKAEAESAASGRPRRRRYGRR